jgi:hypothetical protein
MSAAEALKAARAAGTRVGIDGDDLVLEASAPPPCAVLDLLSRHKADIVTLLQGQRGQGQEGRGQDGQVPVRLHGNVGGVVRPAGYSDLEWRAAIADAKRLGYPPKARP